MRNRVWVFGCAVLMGLSSCTADRSTGERPAESRVADQPGNPDLDGFWGLQFDIHQENGRWVVVVDDDGEPYYAPYVRASGNHIEFEFGNKDFYSLTLSSDGTLLTGYYEGNSWEGHRQTGPRRRKEISLKYHE